MFVIAAQAIDEIRQQMRLFAVRFATDGLAS
jgi:hypothetical protein